MSSDESSSSLEFQECILKCKDAKEFFSFPKKKVMRHVWLYKLGLEADEFYPQPVCDRHFSDKMFDSNKKLTAIAVPDLNLPNTDIELKKCTTDFSDKMIDSNKKLTAIAVPDLDLPNTDTKLKKCTTDVIKTISPIQPGRRGNAAKKITKTINISRAQLKTSRPTPKATPSNLNTNSSTIANASSNMSWIDDSSKILVDYQLKVKGKHLCDVIEIPQFIVVFTVVKAKQTNQIPFNDTKKSQNKAKTTKRPALKNLPKPTAFITIDDDADEVDKVPVPESAPKVTVQVEQRELPAVCSKPKKIVQPRLQPVKTKPIEIVQPELPAVQTKSQEIVQAELPAIQITPLEIVPLECQAVQAKSAEIVQPKLPIVETKPLEIIQPELPAGIPEKSQAERIRLKRKPEPEINVVYYTTDEGVLPRRDRSVQVDFSNKRRETSIQCDVQMDNDIGEMSCNGELYWLQSRFKMKNPQINLDECLVCGEILSNYTTKVIHAHGHEESPSLCSQCGDIFDNQIKLKIHEKTIHSNDLKPWKPLRCPKRNCNKAFRSKNLLNNHIEEHIGTKQHKCNKCLEFFSSSMKLSCHQRALDKCLRTRGWTSKRWTKRI